ncbi:DUF441 domain-containing protein [Paenibacillus antri]|uniref:UPF0756 membrane protein FE782_14635 n=1 Tax=Paenibacillus antri TaxID=2582848 RepID=A0A5R9G6G0_9BACL|nr:DUF441 domain-containing protein [Paenibacillus antri]TLS51351.1 DUF441 domain-containing protein [Paenibacillus antri]
MPSVDLPSAALLVLAALGILGNNSTVAIAVVALLLLRVTKLHQVFPWLENYGLTAGVVILTIGILAPIASGSLDHRAAVASLLRWQSLAAVAVGLLVAYLGGRGVTLMSQQPAVVTGLLLGTILGVALFRGVPVGPLIAAGILSVLLGAK